MSYARSFFNKELLSIEYQDVVAFFHNEQIESDIIEFKSYLIHGLNNHKDRETAILKTICGMLNSEGGLIIWGAPSGVQVPGQKERSFLGALDPLPQLVEKDSFMRTVASTITPSPHGIRFHSTMDNGNYVCIIEVDKSSYSPHQFKNTYYMRIDGQTRPAPHHFVEALFRKVTYPKLKGFLRSEELVIHGMGAWFTIGLRVFIFNLSKLQNEVDLYYRLIINPWQFVHDDAQKGIGRIYKDGGKELIVRNTKDTLYYGEPFTISETVRISPGTRKCTGVLIFGGKSSPLQVSEYKFEIHGTKYLSIETIPVLENSYFHEYGKGRDLSDEEKIKLILDDFQ